MLVKVNSVRTGQFRRVHGGGPINDVAHTLPQVAATLAAAVVAYYTHNGAGERMLNGTMLNAVLVLMLATSILGPVLTERFAPRLRPALSPAEARRS
jgi:hypothetical protein